MDFYLEYITSIDHNIAFYHEILNMISLFCSEKNTQGLEENMRHDTINAIDDLMKDRERIQNIINFIGNTPNCTMYDIIKKMLDIA
jgi:hypothetical protein